jgi:hypothetical protein
LAPQRTARHGQRARRHDQADRLMLQRTCDGGTRHERFNRSRESAKGSRLGQPVAGPWQGLTKDVSPLKSCSLQRRREAIFQAGETAQRLVVPGEVPAAKALRPPQTDATRDAFRGALVFW